MPNSKTEIDTVTLINLFKEGQYPKFIAIPEYQRNYSWEKKHVQRFLDDIFTDVSTRSRLFEKSSFGILIGSLSEDEKTLNIVDGQQRLATLQIFMLVLRHYIKEELKETEDSDRVLWNSLLDLPGQIGECLVYGDDPKFVFNYHDKNEWIDFCAKRDLVSEKYSEIKAKGSLKSNIDITFLTIFDEFKAKKNSVDEFPEWLINLWKWLSGKNREKYGVRVTVAIESDPVKAIERFDRENNRGLKIGLDDLFRSYLIEAINRSSRNKNRISEESNIVVESWSKYYRNTSSLNNKDTFIKWYMRYKLQRANFGNLGFSKAARDAIVPSQLSRYSDRNFWDPIKTAKEIVHWSKIYKNLTSFSDSSALTETESRLNFFSTNGFTQLFGFLLPLKVELEKRDENYRFKIDENTGIPVELLERLEYIILSQQLTKSHQPRDWNPMYVSWSSTLKSEKVLQGQMDDIILELHEKHYREPELFWDEYNRHLEDYKRETLTTGERRTHTRILVQAERTLSQDRSMEFKERSVRGNHLEHICPENHKKWAMVPANQADKSLLNSDELFEIRKYKQHIGNHTILFHDWNVKMSDDSFYYKKEGHPRYTTRGSPQYVEKDKQPCYRNALPKISQSICNFPVKFTKREILERGKTILTAWIEACGENIENLHVNPKEELVLKSRESSINDLISQPESNVLEFKAGFFNLKGGPKTRPSLEVDLEDKLMPDRISKAVNAMLNTDGGKILLGVRDGDKSAEDIAGIESHIDEIGRSEKYLGKGDPEDLLLRVITQKINSSISNKEYQKSWKLEYHETGFGNKIIVISVNPADIADKPILYKNTEYYLHRPGPINIAIQADKKPDKLEFDANGDYIVKDELQILSKSEKKNQVKCFKTIGPFRDKNTAITYMKKLASIGILSSEPVKDSQESLNGRMALMIIDDLVERLPKYKPWAEFWLLVVKNIPKSWNIPDEEDFYPTTHKSTCSSCQKQAKTNKKVIDEFGFKWDNRQGKYHANNICKSCRRG